MLLTSTNPTFTASADAGNGDSDGNGDDNSGDNQNEEMATLIVVMSEWDSDGPTMIEDLNDLSESNQSLRVIGYLYENSAREIATQEEASSYAEQYGILFSFAALEGNEFEISSEDIETVPNFSTYFSSDCLEPTPGNQVYSHDSDYDAAINSINAWLECHYHGDGSDNPEERIVSNPPTMKSTCVGGTAVNDQYISSSDTQWVRLGFLNDSSPFQGDPAWDSQIFPLSMPSIPLAPNPQWKAARVQLNTPHIINNAYDYTYDMISGSTTAPGGSQYVWVDIDPANPQWSQQNTGTGYDFNDVVGLFVFRHDFQVPSNAYDFEFAAIGYADNYFMKDPFTGTSDFSIRTTANLQMPFVGLNPMPSNTHPMNTVGLGYHIGDDVTNNPISHAYHAQPTMNQETDLSFVTFVDNHRLMGALAYHLTVKYCVPDPDPPDPFTPPPTGDETASCSSDYDAGLLSVSNPATTAYRMHAGSASPTWYQSGLAEGHLIPPTSGYQWGQADTYWDPPSPSFELVVAHYANSWGSGTGGYMPQPGATLPDFAENSQWVWNGQYAKEFGIHDFGQVVSLNNLNMPSNAILTDLDAVVYFSADNQLISVSTSNAAQTQGYGTMHVDYNSLFSQNAMLPHSNFVHRTGTVGNGYSLYEPMRPIIDPTTNQPPTGDVLFTISATDNDNPQFTGTGEMENVDPAGLRFAILLCAKWDYPTSPIPAVKCTPEETEMYSGQNATEIRALQRDDQGRSTIVLGYSTATGPVAPHYAPEPWQDMEVLSYKNLDQPTGQNGQIFTVLNEEYHQYAHGHYIAPNGWNNNLGYTQQQTQAGSPNLNFFHMCSQVPTNGFTPNPPYAVDWFPSMTTQLSSYCYAAVNNNNAYQPHNSNADWMMYGNPIIDGTVRAPGMDDAHMAPMGLKEVRIPFTIPADAEPGSVTIYGDIGLAADMVGSVGFAYVYPACIGPGGAGSAVQPCLQEETLFPEFTRGVSIVSQSNPSVSLQSVTADPLTSHRQTDGHHKAGSAWGGHGDGLPLSMTGVQAPGDYYLKFYIAVDTLLITDFENPPTSVHPVTGEVLDSTPKKELQPFSMKWAFDVEYEVCEILTPTGGGGSGSGGGSVPFLSPTTVLLILAVAAYTSNRKKIDRQEPSETLSI